MQKGASMVRCDFEFAQRMHAIVASMVVILLLAMT